MIERHPRSGESLAGSLLIAHPALRDPHFRRTVILLSTHGPEGAMGVVVNRPLGTQLGLVKTDLALGGLSGTPIFGGGPVDTEQLILAAWQGGEDSFQLHFGIDPQKALELAKESGACIRAFLGYSGWSAGQLEGELETGTWIVASPPANLFERTGNEALWRSLLTEEGEEWRLLAEEPDEPGKN